MVLYPESLGSSGIPQGSRMFPCKDDEFTIEVSFLTGAAPRVEWLTVKDSDLVQDVKDRLRELRKLNGATGVKLIFQGSALPDGRTLKSLGVGTARGSLVYVVEAEGAGSSASHRGGGLRILNLTGGHVTVPAQNFDTVLKVKLALEPISPFGSYFYIFVYTKSPRGD